MQNRWLKLHWACAEVIKFEQMHYTNKEFNKMPKLYEWAVPIAAALLMCWHGCQSLGKSILVKLKLIYNITHSNKHLNKFNLLWAAVLHSQTYLWEQVELWIQNPLLYPLFSRSYAFSASPGNVNVSSGPWGCFKMETSFIGLAFLSQWYLQRCTSECSAHLSHAVLEPQRTLFSTPKVLKISDLSFSQRQIKVSAKWS